MTKPSIAIIGFGDFAQLMVQHLHPYADIVVASRRAVKNDLCRAVSNEEALTQPIIIPSMPAQFLKDYFTEHRHLVNPEALIVDICSVKVKPIEVLSRILPTTVEILATHPLFGPASAKQGLKDLRIMVHATRIDPKKYERIKLFLASELQLQVIECTPEEHDRMMAYAQGLSHYIARLMQIMDIPKTILATRAYDDLYDMKQIQGNDSWELFESIMYQNPYTLQVNQDFKKAIEQLDQKLKP